MVDNQGLTSSKLSLAYFQRNQSPPTSFRLIVVAELSPSLDILENLLASIPPLHDTLLLPFSRLLDWLAIDFAYLL